MNVLFVMGQIEAIVYNAHKAIVYIMIMKMHSIYAYIHAKTINFKVHKV